MPCMITMSESWCRENGYPELPPGTVMSRQPDGTYAPYETKPPTDNFAAIIAERRYRAAKAKAREKAKEEVEDRDPRPWWIFPVVTTAYVALIAGVAYFS